MESHTIAVTRTAHYFSLGQVGPHIRQFWLVCHGYGQLADQFLENFASLDNGERLIIAPEGLNHAYLNGFDGPVGSNWLTKHHRDTEIMDCSIYLQTIYDHYKAQLPRDVQVVLLGFSQGTATLCRWITKLQPEFQDLILWAGLPPEDLDYESHLKYLSSKNLYLLYGTSDPFLTPDQLLSVQELENKNGIDFQEQPFEGGHEIPGATLQELLRKME